MFSGCCCCRDVYYWNADSATIQYKTRAGSTVPSIKHSNFNDNFPLQFPFYAVDYHNKRLALIDNTAPRNLRITNDLNLKDTVLLAPTVGASTAGFHSILGMCCDWLNQRIFYTVVKSSGTGETAFRVISYDGSGHDEIATALTVPNPPFGPAQVIIYERQLFYDPPTDRLFYLRNYTSFAPGPPFPNSTFHVELRTMAGDGTNDQLVVSLPTDIAYSTPYPHLALPINKMIISWRQENGPTFEEHLGAYDLDTGVHSSILVSVDDLEGTPYSKFSTPQYCYKDGMIYFQRQLINVPGPTYNNATYERVNLDGSENEVIFSWADPDPPFTDNPFDFGTGQISIARVGCGFEQTGPGYVGIG